MHTSLTLCIHTVAKSMAHDFYDFLMKTWKDAGVPVAAISSLDLEHYETRQRQTHVMANMLEIALLAPTDTGLPLDLANEKQVREFLLSTPAPGTEAAKLMELFRSAPIAVES